MSSVSKDPPLNIRGWPSLKKNAPAVYLNLVNNGQHDVNHGTQLRVSCVYNIKDTHISVINDTPHYIIYQYIHYIIKYINNVIYDTPHLHTKTCPALDESSVILPSPTWIFVTENKTVDHTLI